MSPNHIAFSGGTVQAALLLTLTFLFSACSPNGNSTPQNNEKQVFDGDVYVEAQKIYGKESNLYPCDKLQKDKVLELTKAVESNRSKIDELIKNKKLQQPGSDEHFYKLGGIEFFDKTQTAPIKDEWVQEYFSWKKIYDLFERIREDKNHLDWISLNKQVREIIPDDRGRILMAVHPGLRRQEADRVQKISSAAEECYKDANCVSMSLQSNDLAWLFEGLWHLQTYSNIHNDEYSFEERRLELKELADEMSSVISRYKFHYNPSIKVIDNELKVPVQLKSFGADKEKIAKIVEEKWSVYGLKVKIVLSDAPEALKIIVKNTPGERDHVDFEKNEMTLFEPIATTTLVHEFGHILGLLDSYYTSFNQSYCFYIDEKNYNDIMSVSSTGQILPSHIEQIKKAYGIKDTPQSVSPGKSVDLDVVKSATN